MPLLTSAFATVDIAMAIVTGLVVVSSIPSLISKVTMDIEGGGGLLTMCWSGKLSESTLCIITVCENNANSKIFVYRAASCAQIGNEVMGISVALYVKYSESGRPR